LGACGSRKRLLLLKGYPRKGFNHTLLSGLAGRAGLVVKAVAEPHALHIAANASEAEKK